MRAFELLEYNQTSMLKTFGDAIMNKWQQELFKAVQNKGAKRLTVYTPRDRGSVYLKALDEAMRKEQTDD